MAEAPRCRALIRNGAVAFLALSTLIGTRSVAVKAQDAVGNAGAAITSNVDASQVGAPVSKYIYGGFMENGGSLVYRSLWSELLDDRKFFTAISSKDSDYPTTTLRGPRRNDTRKWRPVGPDEVVAMDTDHPFVGDHSPRIALDSTTPHGIRQTGLTLVKGKHYTGRIYLRGTPGAKVKVALIWGEGANDRQTVSVAALTSAYTKYPLSFTANADSNAATLEIIGTGSGNFHIGAVSLMPADNIQGFRPDTIALLRGLRAGMWRLPGGNFISGWNWYDSVGDIDKRPAAYDYAWNVVQSNDVGMDEWMTVCKLIGVDPYITVNAGFGDAHSAAEEVEYINGAVNTPMGALRARNGHPAPYHVKYWNVGNEPYGNWQLGHTDLRFYIAKHIQFAQAMRKADPSITILASGAMPDEMTVEAQPRVLHRGYIEVKMGDPEFDWTGGLIANSLDYFEGLTEHLYPRDGKRFDYSYAVTLGPDVDKEAGYVPVNQTLLEWARYPSNRVQMKAEEWAEYLKRFPAMVDKKIFLSIDEYAYGGASNLKLALSYGMLFNEMLRHTEMIKMAAYTMSTSTLEYTPTGAVYNTRGVLYKMYRDHFGTLPVAVSGNSPQPAVTSWVGADQPAVNAGSPTYPLDMVAALTADRKYLTVAVVNATESAQTLNLNISGVHRKGDSTLYLMTGKDQDAANHVGQPPQVEVKEIAIGDAPRTLLVAPISVNIYRFPVVQAAQ